MTSNRIKSGRDSKLGTFIIGYQYEKKFLQSEFIREIFNFIHYFLLRNRIKIMLKRVNYLSLISFLILTSSRIVLCFFNGFIINNQHNIYFYFEVNSLILKPVFVILTIRI